MLNEILQTTRSTLAERLASPLIGGFLVSWCLWNWKFLVILFSDAGVTQTFTLIHTFVFPDTASIITKGILYPLLTTLIYVFVYPYPARQVYGFTLRQQRAANRLRQTISEETLLTLEESRALRSEYVEHERKSQESIERLSEEIARLNAALDARNTKDATKPLSTAEKLYDKLEPSQLQVLALLEKAGGSVPELELVQMSEQPKVQVQFDIGELERRELISKRMNVRSGGRIVEFTHEGRRTLLKSKQEQEPEA
ncbi:MAG: hypothetical protein ACK5JG_12330 [Pseudomonadota bacterium]